MEKLIYDNQIEGNKAKSFHKNKNTSNDSDNLFQNIEGSGGEKLHLRMWPGCSQVFAIDENRTKHGGITGQLWKEDTGERKLLGDVESSLTSSKGAVEAPWDTALNSNHAKAVSLANM